MKISLKDFSVLLCLTVGNSAYADILFIDVNNTPTEIAAAQKAAAQRGEKLILYPDQSSAAAQAALKKLKAITDKISILEAPLLTAYQNLDSNRTALAKESQSPHPDAAKMAALQAKVNQYTDAYTAEETKITPQMTAYQAQIDAIPNLPKISADALDQLVTSYHNQHKTISSIIISGHHGDDDFDGYLGDITQEDVRGAFSKYPEMYAGVRSVYGWGCYSATLSGSHWWFNAFPNVALVGGFDAGAPSSTRPADLEYLSGILVKEKQLIQTTDIKNIQAQVKTFAGDLHSIPGFNQTNAAACTRSVCVGMNTGDVDMNDLSKTCDPRLLDVIQAGLDRLNEVSAGEELVPCDTQNSWLRDLYNTLRQHEYCATQKGPNQAAWAPILGVADVVIKFIFWGQVESNIVHYYQSDFTQFKSISDRYNLNMPDLSQPFACDPETPGAKSISSKELNAFYTSVATAAGTCLTSDLASMQKMAEHLGMITSLQCVPFTWVEPPRPGGALDKPECEDPIEVQEQAYAVTPPAPNPSPSPSAIIHPAVEGPLN